MANTLQNGLILLVAGAGLTWFFARPIVRTLASRRWPHVQGEVTATHDDAVNSPTSTRGDSWSLAVRYRYTVEGKTYDSDRISFVGRWISRHHRPSAMEDLKQYAKGRHVDVRYDPEDPATAVIDVSIPWASVAIAGLSLFFLVAALIGVARILLGSL